MGARGFIRCGAVALLAALAAGSGGCVAFPEEIESVERQLGRLRQEMAGLKKSSESARGLLEERVSRLEASGPRPAASERPAPRTEPDGSATGLNERLHELLGEFRVLQGKLEEQAAALELLQRRVDRLEAGPSAPAVPPRGAAGPPPALPASTPPPAGSPAAAPTGGEDLYRSALGDYTRGNYDLAVKGFRDYLQRAPGGSQTANARYWLGESYYSQRDYTRAVEEFAAVATQHADSPKAPSALFKQGQAYQNLGDARRAGSALCELLARYPKTREAQLARERGAQCR